MSVLGGEFHFSDVTRKIAEIQAVPTFSDPFLAYGDGLFIVKNSQSLVRDSNGVRGRLTTSSVPGNTAGMQGEQQWRRDQACAAYFRFKVFSTGILRMFAGLTDYSDFMAKSSDITANYCGVAFDSSVDTEFQWYRNDGGLHGNRSSTGRIFGNEVLHLYIWTIPDFAGGKIIMQLGHDSERVQFITDIPQDASNLKYDVSIQALASGARAIEIGKIFLEQVY